MSGLAWASRACSGRDLRVVVRIAIILAVRAVGVEGGNMTACHFGIVSGIASKVLRTEEIG